MKTSYRLTRSSLAASVAIAIVVCMPLASQAKQTAKKHILVVTVTKGFRHDSIPLGEQTITDIGAKTGEWDTDYVRTDEEMATKMTADALKKYDAVIFENTTGVLPLPDPQGFLDYIKAGHGFAAIHSGSDTFHEWPGGKPGEVSAYIDMLGGEFLTHHAQSAITMHIADERNPATRPIVAAAGKTSAADAAAVDLHQHTVAVDHVYKAFDEIYLLKNNDPAKVHVLLWLDKYPDDGSPDANSPGIHLISWVKSYGEGRVFYTVLGHRQETWRDPIYQAHITGGIEFVLGLKRGSTKTGQVLTAN